MSVLRRILIKFFPQFMKSEDLVQLLRKKGIHVGKGTVFYYPNTINIDLQRPWMIEIGDYCKITKGTVILAHDYSRSVVRKYAGLIVGEAGVTKIGNNVFIGMNSILLMGAKIGNNCIVGAGSVVKGEFPDNSVIAGNPAKIICTMDEYVKKRIRNMDDEGVEYVNTFISKYGRVPQINEMGPFFSLFLKRDRNELLKNNISLNWSGDEESEILNSFLNSEPRYSSYTEFLKHAKERREKMYKIGILTIPRADNYGSVLQAYAMQRFVNNVCGESELIDYVSPFLINRYPLWKIEKGKNIYTLAKSIFQNFMCYRRKKQKKKKFEDFRSLMKFSPQQIYDSKLIDNYDYYIAGSDQIWNTRITRNDSTFFLDFVYEKRKKIAFSVSMGYENREYDEIKFYEKVLTNFRFIGVREINDVDFVKKCTDENTECDYILDPTLLIEEKYWKEFIYPTKIIKNKYILVYEFGRDKKVIETAKKFSKQYKLPVYTISDEWRKKNSDGFFNLKGIGPIDFLNLIANAELIITNSFHGTAFSIIFRKQFISVPYCGTENRVISLLSLLKIDSALYDGINKKYNVDYQYADKLLDIQREKAVKKLLEAIKGN